MNEREFKCSSPSCAAKLLVVGYERRDQSGAARRAGWVRWSGGWMCPRCVWEEG